MSVKESSEVTQGWSVTLWPCMSHLGTRDKELFVCWVQRQRKKTNKTNTIINVYIITFLWIYYLRSILDTTSSCSSPAPLSVNHHLQFSYLLWWCLTDFRRLPVKHNDTFLSLWQGDRFSRDPVLNYCLERSPGNTDESYPGQTGSSRFSGIEDVSSVE